MTAALQLFSKFNCKDLLLNKYKCLRYVGMDKQKDNIRQFEVNVPEAELAPLRDKSHVV
jgi:hypothetical protein